MIKGLHITIKKWIQRRLREGRSFRNISSYLKETEVFSKEEIGQLQLGKLRYVLRESYLNVAYYRRVFDSIGLDINGRFRAEDITTIPFLTKDILSQGRGDFISKRSKKVFLRKATTGGTTGKAIELYRDLYSINFENAVVWKQRAWAGVRHDDRRATMRGEVVVPGSRKRPPFWRYDSLGKELILSSYHISRDNVRYYVEALKRFRPVYIEAYPSSLAILAKFIKESGLEGVSFKAAIVSSETLDDYKKALIEEVFNCKVYNFYGNSERVVAIATCPAGSYHILPEYGYTEFLDCNGNNGYKELIGTSFINMSMPLIRYRTGDVVVPSEEECGCGRKSQIVKKIIGRINDFIVTPDGRFITMMESVASVDNALSNTIESQILQEDRETIKVKVVPTKHFSAADRDRLTSSIKSRIGCNMKIYVETVDSIERTESGKLRQVISNIEGREG